jgi:tol-pal system protein YbgF
MHYFKKSKRMTGVIAFSLCALSCLFILTGCATSNEVGRIRYELQEVKSELRELKEASGKQVSAYDRQLNNLLKELQEQQKATSNSVSDLLIQMQSIKTDLQVLTGRFEEARYFYENTSKELLKDKDLLIAKFKELEVEVKNLKKRLETIGAPKTQKQEALKTPEPEQKETEEVSSLPKRDVKDVYMEAYQAFKSNRFEEARERFRAILENYPENEFSDNARFWIGETYYKEKNYEEAILAYEELLKKNPDSDKVPGALLKQGLAFYKLKKEDVAKTILEELIKKYPETTQAEIAKKKLASFTTRLKKK